MAPGRCETDLFCFRRGPAIERGAFEAIVGRGHSFTFSYIDACCDGVRSKIKLPYHFGCRYAFSRSRLCQPSPAKNTEYAGATLSTGGSAAATTTSARHPNAAISDHDFEAFRQRDIFDAFGFGGDHGQRITKVPLSDSLGD